MPATIRTRAPVSSSAPRAVRLLARRWPALLAVAATLSLWGIDTVTAGQLLPLLPMLYVVVVVVQRRSAIWPLLVGGVALFSLLQVQSMVDPVVAFTALASGALVVALVRGRGRGEVLLQSAAMAAWVVLTVAALAAAPDVARLLLAGGWLAHGLWDLWHLRRDAVVSRSYAEWCGVLDILVAVQLLVLA